MNVCLTRHHLHNCKMWSLDAFYNPIKPAITQIVVKYETTHFTYHTFASETINLKKVYCNNCIPVNFLKFCNLKYKKKKKNAKFDT